MNPTLPRWLSALPTHLSERCHLPAPQRQPKADGEFVLLWLHHAIRVDENPALDVAGHLAAALGRPLLIYQGLAGRHRYNNDRHHRFILEGAREFASELAQRGLRLEFHLPTDPSAPSPLDDLVPRAALVVTEDFPAPPFPRWVAARVAGSDRPWVQIDAACVLPLRLPGKAYARAFAFRDAWYREQRQRVETPWPGNAPDVSPFDGPLGFQPLQLASADLDACIGACGIDHGVPAVPHTRGGSAAGLARWARFRADGLARYAELRNDAAVDWPLGVSRLSPYLHHGHVSPLRIAREAAAHGGRGAEKFLDELLVWRELAFNFCVHTANPESLEALPDWAQTTLAENADAPRPALIDDETLARGRSGDALWDRAQDSLRIHGELHNNLRMTWAKCLLDWRPTPAATLASLIEHNHRFALDGSNPNSYGGLLWTLGLFDRPHPPASGHTGVLRPRSSAAHARRLDLAAFSAKVRRPAAGRVRRVAVIGAGVAGLTAARQLQDHGHDVQVFEKSRGLGGRGATRYADTLQFDHGAQYFTARDPAFCRAVAAWRERGLVALWRPRLGRLDACGVKPLAEDRERLVAVPGMNALGRHLGADLAVRRLTRVAPPAPRDEIWRLFDDQGQEIGVFDALLIAVPAPQAAALLANAAPALAASAEALEQQPCWTAMLGFSGPVETDFDAVFGADGVIAWAACNASKPGRDGATWVVHASADWSREHLGQDRQSVARALSEHLCSALDLPTTALGHLDAHSWLYAQTDAPLSERAWETTEPALAVAGDWLAGGRIEGAFLSGQAAAARLLAGFASA